MNWPAVVIVVLLVLFVTFPVVMLFPTSKIAAAEDLWHDGDKIDPSLPPTP